MGVVKHFKVDDSTPVKILNRCPKCGYEFSVSDMKPNYDKLIAMRMRMHRKVCGKAS